MSAGSQAQFAGTQVLAVFASTGATSRWTARAGMFPQIALAASSNSGPSLWSADESLVPRSVTVSATAAKSNTASWYGAYAQLGPISPLYFSTQPYNTTLPSANTCSLLIPS